MFAPTPRLLWMVFLLVVPAFTLIGLASSLWPFVAVLLLLLTAMLTLDAVRLRKTTECIRVTAESPVSVYKDRAAHLPVAIELPAGAQASAFALDLPATFQQDEAILETKTSSTLRFAFTPQSRGEFLVNRAFVWTASEWQFWRLRDEKAIAIEVKVFPDLLRDTAARHLIFKREQGQRVQRVVGRGREVERLRDYAPGDSFDEVYWKGTARRGAPVSKVFQIERTQDIYAVVDGSRLSNRKQALERFVSASLLLALAAEKNGDNFGLLTFRENVERFVRAAHGNGHFHRCREAIYDLQPVAVSPDFTELFTFINLRIRRRSLLFFLTDLSDPLLAETFLENAGLVTRRHVVLVDQIADAADRPLFSGALPESEAEVHDRLAGHLQWAKLRELEKALRHVGVRMQLLRPEQTSAELINQYRTIKQRQLL